MSKTTRHWMNTQVRRILRTRFAKIREINRKYATPRIKMTKTSKMVLLMLRLYLLLLVGILFYKFCTLLK